MSQDNPIRVAQVMGKMLGGGVETVVMNYYRRIDRSRVQFDFLVDSDSTLVPREEIESLGGRVFRDSSLPAHPRVSARASASLQAGTLDNRAQPHKRSLRLPFAGS